MKLFSLAFALFLILGSTSSKKIVCYYTSWAMYLSGEHKVAPTDLDPNLCTHINYAFISITPEGGLTLLDEYADIELGGFANTVALKQANPSLKVLLSIGGGNSPASQFSAIAADAGKRAAMVGSARYFMETYGFDGIDIDWEVPGAADKGNFMALINDFKNDFSRNGWLVTAAVSASTGDGYDIPAMSNTLDHINIMTYDMYGPGWSQYTGQNAALYPASIESEWEKQNCNMAAALNNWKNYGADPNKLIAGIPFYGHTYTLADPNNNGIHAPFTGPGNGGPITNSPGAFTYAEFCETQGQWSCRWDDEQKVPICVNGNQWLGTDNVDSVREKVNFINNNGFGGAMIWAIDQDDVHGRCGGDKPLLRAVHDNLM